MRWRVVVVARLGARRFLRCLPAVCLTWSVERTDCDHKGLNDDGTRVCVDFSYGRHHPFLCIMTYVIAHE